MPGSLWSSVQFRGGSQLGLAFSLFVSQTGGRGKKKMAAKGKRIKIQHNTCTFSAAWMCELALHKGNRNRSKLEKSWMIALFLGGGGCS